MSDNLPPKSPERTEVSFEIRQAQPDDAAAIAKLYKDVWLATYPNELANISLPDIEEEVADWDSKENITQWRAHLSEIDPHSLRIVSTAGTRICGYCWFMRKDESVAKLKALYVLPEFHGEGIADNLIEQGLAWVGGSEITLEVAKYSLRAIRFYEKWGFFITGPAESDAALLKGGKTIPEVLMKRPSKT